MTARSVRIGALAGAGMALFYVTVVAGASGSWQHLTDQARQDWYYLVAIIAGFAAQVAMFTELRRRHHLPHGAIFKITLDTHSVDLSTDLTKSASLDVGGVAWTVSGWSGDGPGGHHREGTLAFTPGGPAAGAVRLVIALPHPVDVAWTPAS